MIGQQKTEYRVGKRLLDYLIEATQLHNDYQSQCTDNIEKIAEHDLPPENNGGHALYEDIQKREKNKSILYRLALRMILDVAKKNKSLTYRQADPHVLAALIEVGTIDPAKCQTETSKTQEIPNWYSKIKNALEQIEDATQMSLFWTINEQRDGLTKKLVSTWLDLNEKLGEERQDIREAVENGSGAAST